jgi:hypothetical protein
MLDEGSIAAWMERPDATSAEPEPFEGQIAESAWGLIDKHVLRGGRGVSLRIAMILAVAAWAIVVGWMFLQDNNAGRLDTQLGITRFWLKTKIAAAFFGSAAGLIVVLGWLPRFPSWISRNVSAGWRFLFERER